MVKLKSFRDERTIKQRLDYMLWHSNLDALRILIGLSSLFWAGLLLWGSGIIQPDVILFSPTRTTYRLMADIAPALYWSAAFFVHTCFAFGTLLSGRYNWFLWVGDAFFGAVLWTVATVTCFASHWTIGTPYAAPAAMSAELGVMLSSYIYLIRWSLHK